MKIAVIIDKIGLGSIRLPDFQRGYVWKADHASCLLDSLYREYPIGIITLWSQPSASGAVSRDL